MQAHTIGQVIELLDEIIEKEIQQNSKLAFFPILYKKVTEAVKDGIEKEEFEDNDRMEKLDVVFANRYLEAYTQFKARKHCTACWKVAFDQGHKFWPITLQHLLLGINAHINLDLGIAAAEIAGSKIENLKNDFYRINDLLSGMVEGVQHDINRISPVIGLLDSIAGKLDERLVDFSIQIARDGAWDFALTYAEASGDQKTELLEKRDMSISWLGKDIARPGWFLTMVTYVIKVLETKSVKKIATALSN